MDLPSTGDSFESGRVKYHTGQRVVKQSTLCLPHGRHLTFDRVGIHGGRGRFAIEFIYGWVNGTSAADHRPALVVFSLCWLATVNSFFVSEVTSTRSQGSAESKD